MNRGPRVTPRAVLLLLVVLSACGTETPVGSHVAGIYAELAEFLLQRVSEATVASTIPA